MRLCVRLVLVAIATLCLAMALGWLFRADIALWDCIRRDSLRIYGNNDTTLPEVHEDDYSKILVCRYRGGHGISAELHEVSEECKAEVRKWLLGPHTKAMPSYGDFAPDYKISLHRKSESTKNCLVIVTISGDFIFYDYEVPGQYLRLMTGRDRRLTQMLESELSR